jgi:hypothetical protein
MTGKSGESQSGTTETSYGRWRTAMAVNMPEMAALCCWTLSFCLWTVGISENGTECLHGEVVYHDAFSKVREMFL